MRRMSIVILNFAVKLLGPRCGAACHVAVPSALANPSDVSCDELESRNDRWLTWYLLSLNLTGFYDGSIWIFIGGIIGGLLLPSHILKTLSYVSAICENSYAPSDDNPFCSASVFLDWTSCLMVSGRSSRNSTFSSPVSSPSSSNW